MAGHWVTWRREELPRRPAGQPARKAAHAVLPAYPAAGVQLALFKGYAAPRLPRAAYAHGVDAKAHQAVMARECRRIVLRWLDGANPSIGSAEALTVLDAERWGGLGRARAAGCQAAAACRAMPGV